MTPLAPERFALQVTISRATHDDLRRAQELLSHALPSGDVAEVLARALKALIHELEKRKFAATPKPRAKARASENPRHIPARVKRAVMARDGGRCTFVSDCGRRCSSRKFLEFDHVEPVALSGTATVSGIRLRCRAHNQYAADCTFGAGFMDDKRRAAAGAREAVRQQAAAQAREPAKRLPRAGAIAGPAALADAAASADPAAPADPAKSADSPKIAKSAANVASAANTGSGTTAGSSAIAASPPTAATRTPNAATVSMADRTNVLTAPRDTLELPSLAETFARARLAAAVISRPVPASSHPRPAIGT